MRLINQSKLYIPGMIFIFFAGFYLFTAKGILTVADSQINFQTTRALVDTHSLAIDCRIKNHFIQIAPDGRCYGKYDLGLAISSIPLYLLARALFGPDPADLQALSLAKLSVSTLNQFVTAATCAMLYIFAYRLCGSRRQSLSLVFLFGISTIAWPYASLHLSQPLVAFLLLVAVLILANLQGESFISLIGVGLALGWACLTRLDAVPLAFVVSIYALYQLRQQRIFWRKMLFQVAFLIAPAMLAVSTYFVHNRIRGGNPFQIGYPGEGWDTPFGLGLYGLLFSPGKGIVYYSPLVILAVLGLRRLWQRGWKAEAVLISSLSITQLTIYSSWWAWEGGWTWGPRFLVSTHPLLMLGLLPWLDQERPTVPVIILSTLGFLVQLIGVTTDPITYLTRTRFTYSQTLFTVEASPLLGQFQDLLQRRVSLLITSRAHGLFTFRQTLVFGGLCLFLMITSGRLLKHAINETLS